MAQVLFSLLLIVQLLLGQLLQFHSHANGQPEHGHSHGAFPHIHLQPLCGHTSEEAPETPASDEGDVLPLPDLGTEKAVAASTMVGLDGLCLVAFPEAGWLGVDVSSKPCGNCTDLPPVPYAGPLFLLLGTLLI